MPCTEQNKSFRIFLLSFQTEGLTPRFFVRQFKAADVGPLDGVERCPTDLIAAGRVQPELLRLDASQQMFGLGDGTTEQLARLAVHIRLHRQAWCQGAPAKGVKTLFVSTFANFSSEKIGKPLKIKDVYMYEYCVFVFLMS